jgi:DegV family protein with EDD domain
MKLGFVTDSPADLTADQIERYNIEVIPAILVLDGQPYLDSIEITREQFYQRLPTFRQPATTAAPSPADFASRYEKLLTTGCDHIISLHTAEKLTSIANIARQVAADFNNQITVLESGSLSLGTGFQIEAAAEAAARGLNLESVLEQIQSARHRVCVGAALDTLEYLHRSGRFPAAVTLLGSLLNIKPVLDVREGVIRPLGAARTTRQATNLLLNTLQEHGPLEKLAILHTNAPQRASNFLASLRASPACPSLPEQIPLVNVTSLIGTHAGPNGLGFAALKKEPVL